MSYAVKSLMNYIKDFLCVTPPEQYIAYLRELRDELSKYIEKVENLHIGEGI